MAFAPAGDGVVRTAYFYACFSELAKCVRLKNAFRALCSIYMKWPSDLRYS